MVSNPNDPALPEAYGGCRCNCHTDANVRHVVPCCYPVAADVELVDVQPTPHLCGCGLTMSKNPHPDAGKPGQLLEVGAVYVCIPCAQQARFRAYQRRVSAEAIASAFVKADDGRLADEGWLRDIGAGDDASGCYVVIDIPGTDDPARAPQLQWLLDDEAPGRIGYLSIDGTDAGLTVKTRGQVRLLLRALGIPSDVNWPAADEVKREVSDTI